MAISTGAIIVQGKTVELATIDASAAGSKSYLFVNEAEALKVNCNIVSMTNSIYWELYEIHGDTSDNETLVYQSPTLRNATGSMSDKFDANSKLRLDVYYTGELNIELSATGIASSSLTGHSQLVHLNLTKEDKRFRSDQVSLLSEMRDELKKINNHMRHVTGIEQEKAKVF